MSMDKSFIQLFFLSTKEHRFCLPLAKVERLLFLMELQPVPQAPDYLVGLMNLYGEAVPVIDLALRIGLEHKDNYTVQTPVVLINNGDQKSALIIDNIEDVKTINSNQLRGEKLFEGGEPPITATIVTNSGTALLLDIQRILDIDLSAMREPLILGEELLSLCQMRNLND